MRILSYTFETTIEFSSLVRDHDFVLRCMPRTRPGKQTVLDAHVMIAPNGPLAKQFDGFGNVLRIGRARAAHKTFSFASSGMVVVNGDVDADMQDPRDAWVHPLFLQPSKLAAADAARSKRTPAWQENPAVMRGMLRWRFRKRSMPA